MNKLPEKHSRFLEPFLRAVNGNNCIIGIAAIGSLGFGDIDKYSDLDLIVVCEEAHRDDLLEDAERFAQGFGPLLSCYRGHHVGEPRLLVCLYGEPLLHVDFTFMTLGEFAADRVQVPAILLDQKGKIEKAVSQVEVDFPKPDRQGIETKFWVWTFNATNKLARGDLFSALSYISTIRKSALVPLIQENAGVAPRGFRTLQTDAPEWCERLIRTHPRELSQKEIARGLQETVGIYCAIRSEGNTKGVVFNAEAEKASCAFLDSVRSTFSGAEQST